MGSPSLAKQSASQASWEWTSRHHWVQSGFLATSSSDLTTQSLTWGTTDWESPRQLSDFALQRIDQKTKTWTTATKTTTHKKTSVSAFKLKLSYLTLNGSNKFQLFVFFLLSGNLLFYI